MKYILNTLKALKLFDDDNTLSLTSIVLMVITYKLATAAALDWTIITAFFVTILSYNTKKYMRKHTADKQATNIDRISQVEEAIKQVKTMVALKK